MRDSIYCSKHCAAYLYDAGKLVALTQYTGMETLSPDCGITLVPGTAGKVKLQIPAQMQAAAPCKWAYSISDSATPVGKFGTALTGSSDYADSETEIVTGGKLRLHLYLCGPDLKPVKVLVLSVAGE